MHSKLDRYCQVEFCSPQTSSALLHNSSCYQQLTTTAWNTASEHASAPNTANNSMTIDQTHRFEMTPNKIQTITTTTTAWVKKILPEIFWHFFPNGWEFLVQILHAYYMFLSTLDYRCFFNYLQLWRSYAILSATTIMCSKCPPSTETHAGWLHLIWQLRRSWR